MFADPMPASKQQRTTPVSFWAPSGVEVPAVSTEVMREIDRIAMEQTSANLFQMMENAGRNLAEVTLECLGANWQHAGIVVLAGTGGNGGGGIVAARHLGNHGASVELCLAASNYVAAMNHGSSHAAIRFRWHLHCERIVSLKSFYQHIQYKPMRRLRAA